VIDKPAGLVVHPGNGNASGTMLNGLLHHAPQLAGIPRAGIVHRLDKDTSGLLVVAKTLTAQTDLVRQMQARTVKRHYLALALGTVERDGTSTRRSAATPCSARKWHRARRRQGSAHPLRGARALRQGHVARMPAGDRDAPTRSASTWRRSSIRWPAMRCTGKRRAAMRGSMPFRARRCMPGDWRLIGIPQAASRWPGSRRCRRTSRTAGRTAWLVSSFPTGRRRPVCAPCRRRVAVASVMRRGRLQSRRPCRR
jgi:hypothetical protein